MFSAMVLLYYLLTFIFFQTALETSMNFTGLLTQCGSRRCSGPCKYARNGIHRFIVLTATLRKINTEPLSESEIVLASVHSVMSEILSRSCLKMDLREADFSIQNRKSGFGASFRCRMVLHARPWCTRPWDFSERLPSEVLSLKSNLQATWKILRAHRRITRVGLVLA